MNRKIVRILLHSSNIFFSRSDKIFVISLEKSFKIKFGSDWLITLILLILSTKSSVTSNPISAEIRVVYISLIVSELIFFDVSEWIIFEARKEDVFFKPVRNLLKISIKD